MPRRRTSQGDNAASMIPAKPAASPPTAIDTWLVHCDGSAFPNPGTMGLGATLSGPDGEQHQLSVTASSRGCNNEAEARAMMVALQRAKLMGAKNVRVHSDSRVVVDQLSGRDARKIARLEPLFESLRALLASFEQADVAWIPGHRNTVADALARAAAGLSVRPAPKLRRKK